MHRDSDPGDTIPGMAATMTPPLPETSLTPEQIDARFRAKLERQRAGIIDPIKSTTWNTVLDQADRAALDEMVTGDSDQD
jgi:hypothetical protein